MIGPAAVAGFIFAMLYVAYAQQSFVGDPIPWGDIWWNAAKVFAFFFAVFVLFTAPFRSKR